MKKVILSGIVAIGLAVAFGGCAKNNIPLVRSTFEEYYKMTPEQLDNLSESEQIHLINKHSGITESLRILRYMKNPSEKVQLAAIRENVQNLQYIKNPSEEVVYRAFMNKNLFYNPLMFVKNQSLYIQIIAIRENQYSLEYTSNKSKFLQAYAIAYKINRGEEFNFSYLNKMPEFIQTVANAMQNNGIASVEIKNYIKIIEDVKSIEKISNPTEDMVILASLLDSKYIPKIKNPSNELIETLIKLDALNINYIQNPDKLYINLAEQYKDIQKRRRKDQRSFELLKEDINYLQRIKNPSEELQLYAMELASGGNYYSFIKSDNISEKVQLAAIKTWPASIKDMKNPSEKVQLAAAEASGYNHGYNLQYIKNPSEKVQLAAAEASGYSLQYIKNPSEKVQLAAVNNEPLSIKYIKNPSPKVLLSVYGVAELKLNRPAFEVHDSYLNLKIMNDELKITNQSKKFIKIKSIAEYFGKNVDSIEGFSIPPETVITKSLLNIRKYKITSENQIIQYGFAMEYKLQNDNKMHDFYTIKKYKASELLN